MGWVWDIGIAIITVIRWLPVRYLKAGHMDTHESETNGFSQEKVIGRDLQNLFQEGLFEALDQRFLRGQQRLGIVEMAMQL